MNTQEFLAKLAQDEKDNNLTILEKIQTVGKNPEAVYAIAQEVGVTDSFEVFEDEMNKQYEVVSAELSEEELLAVAGGISDAGILGIGVACTGGCIGATLAGAAA